MPENTPNICLSGQSGLISYGYTALPMSCPQCDHMAHESRAASPGQLRQLIAGVKAEFRNGVLEETEHSGKLTGDSQPPFAELPETERWPDYFEYSFHCTSCGQAFLLTAETYHGSGGQWKPIPKRRAV